MDRSDTPLVIGILAHVDAGKTTLSEGLLYVTQSIRRMGRVDNGDTFLDTDAMEKARGITIYSKQARFTSNRPDGTRHAYTLLDTPGHADFSPEMERTLNVLDLAVLVISASEGVNAQVRTLWRLLDYYKVPSVLFINKMDQAENLGGEAALKEDLMASIRKQLSEGVIPWRTLTDPEAAEEIALLDEELLESYLEGGGIGDGEIRSLVEKRKLHPLIFGSALKMQGIDELLEVLDRFGTARTFPDEFGARVFKITRDDSGERLTHVRVTGGSLKVRDVLRYVPDEEEVEEKINQIRLYSGDRYEQVDTVSAGEICALTGLAGTWTGQGLGAEANVSESLIQPVLTWQIKLRMGDDPFKAYRLLRILTEEEPSFQVAYDERLRKITVRMMGRMQREMLADLAYKRFGLEIAFEQPSVIYKETVAQSVEGVGHFEPLRHYAEVHVLLTPGESGSGVILDSALPTDVLAKRWQNLALGALGSRRLRGVLTGSELTDIRITLIAGRAHEKHTEGGDFYQAAHRAVRQGLMMGQSLLLEPWYNFRIEVPEENLGRVLSDMSMKNAVLSAPLFEDGRAVITGRVSVAALGDYSDELASFTKGQGLIDLENGPYLPCPDPIPVIEAAGYDPDADKRYPSASVFCEHGAGTIVPWYEVRSRMHVQSGYRMEGDDVSGYHAVQKTADAAQISGVSRAGADAPDSPAAVTRTEIARRSEEPVSFKDRQKAIFAAEDELKAIFEKTYGPAKTTLPSEERERRSARAEAIKTARETWKADKTRKKSGPQTEYLLVDGYNIIFAWEDLRELAARDIKAARDKLMDILSNYAGYSPQKVILVFDAYKVSGGQEHILKYHNISVIFTKEAETADQYIEKTTHELLKNYQVAVATSDAVEQIIIFGAGARRLSATDLKDTVDSLAEEVREKYLEEHSGGRYFLQNNLSEKLDKLGLKKEDARHDRTDQTDPGHGNDP